MTSKLAICGICDLQHITKPSIVWCHECDEGLCLECNKHHGLSKATRNHITVLISKYETLPTNVLEISQFCSVHKEKCQIYCKKHDCPCCSKCVVSDHQACQDLIQLDVMVQNVKKSYGFHDIEQTIINMLINIQKIKSDRQANLSTLKEERKMYENEIEQTRMKLNSQLDILQKSVMTELYEAESKESKMISQLLDLIEKNEKEIRRYQDDINNIKQHASDLQTVVAMKQMERNIVEKEEFFTILLKGHKLNRVSLSCKINNALQNSFNELKKFGEVIVCSQSSIIEIVRKETQAQIVTVPALCKSIDNLLFILQATIDTKLVDIRGCSLLPDGRMIFSSSSQRCVRGFNRDGSLNFDISLHPTRAYDITYIKDSNTLAVTSGSGINQCISIIDVESKKITETIPMKSYNDGIASSNNTLFCCAGDRGLQIINLSDKSGKNIATSKMVRFAYVATFCDKLYYTNLNTNTVTCDLHGTIQWKFEDKSILTYPQGISVDNDGNVYVVGQVSGNVVVISPDGQRSKQLLSGEDGLDKPAVLDYNRTTNQLLVANHTGKAFLYNLELN